MAKVARNAIISSLTGKLGGVVFRKHQGETVAQLLPQQSNRKRSEAQLARQLRFQEAAHYAKSILSEPLQQKVYQALGAARNRPPNTILISNFLNPPTVDLIEISGYQGRRGDRIKVLATDDVEVVSVTIAIRDQAGAVVESAPAGKNHGVWIYIAT